MIIYQIVNYFQTSSPFIAKTKNNQKHELEPDKEIFFWKIKCLKKIALISVYRPPSSDLANFSRALENIIIDTSNKYERICVLGDFTILSVNWKNKIYFSNITSQSMFCDVINQFSFQQLNTASSNVNGNILDLVFTNAPELFSRIDDYTADISSDPKVFHCRIFREINMILLITKLQIGTILDMLWKKLIYVR